MEQEKMYNRCNKCLHSFPWEQGDTNPPCPKCGEPATGGYFGTPLPEGAA